MFRQKIIFLDPVYQSDLNGIKIRESIYSLVSGEQEKRRSLYESLFGTLEFSLAGFRSFLGVHSFVHLSTNCSYISHLIGNWIIAHYSMDNIVVRSSERRNMRSLRKELYDKDILEEFLVASMLINFPLFPFNDILSRNALLKQHIGKDINSVRTDIISGKGEFYEKVKEIAKAKNMLTIFESLLAFQDKNKGSFSIGKLLKLLSGKNDSQELVLMDEILNKISPSFIDRINRNSFYLGIKSEANLTREMLDNIILLDSKEKPVVVDSDGSFSMSKLLFDWLSLFTSKIEDDYAVSYAYMINEGLNIMLKNNLIEPSDLIGLTDLDFLNLMSSFKPTKNLAERILSKKPYTPIIRGSYYNVGSGAIKQKFDEFIKNNNLYDYEIVLDIKSEFKKDINFENWLSIPVLTTDSRLISFSDASPKLVDYITHQAKIHSNTFYLLSKKQEIPVDVIKKAKEWFRGEILPW